MAAMSQAWGVMAYILWLLSQSNLCVRIALCNNPVFNNFNVYLTSFNECRQSSLIKSVNNQQ